MLPSATRSSGGRGHTPAVPAATDVAMEIVAEVRDDPQAMSGVEESTDEDGDVEECWEREWSAYVVSRWSHSLLTKVRVHGRLVDMDAVLVDHMQNRRHQHRKCGVHNRKWRGEAEAAGMGRHDWSNLPGTALLYVYQGLDDSTRCSMARTCRRWREVFFTPRLWRRRKIYAASSSYKFVKTFGQYIKHVELVLNYESDIRFLRKILNHLRDAKLSTFRCKLRVCDVFSVGLEETSVSKFLQAQSCLERLELTDTRLNASLCLRLLNAMPDGLASLSLHGFMCPPCFLRHRVWERLEGFASLTTLHIDFFWIDEVTLVQLAWSDLGRNLTKLGLYVEPNYDPVISSVISCTWNIVKRANPQLKVDVTCGGMPLKRLKEIVVRHMPLHRLHIPYMLHMNSAMKYVLRTFPSIQELKLQCLRKGDLITLRKILKGCKELKVLHISGEIPVSFLRKIFKDQSVGKISLRLLNADVELEGEDQVSRLGYLLEEFGSALESSLEVRIKSTCTFQATLVNRAASS